jgi:DNA end-binding protein Ku
VVIRARQYLAALIPQGDALVLELLRYDQELVDLSEFELPSGNLRDYSVNRKEIDLAMKLISGMTTKWNASKYHDEYREALMKLVQKKVAAGQTEAIEDVEEEESPIRQTINFMDVLKKSVEHASKGRTKASAKPKTASGGRGRRPRKKRAG